MKDTTLHPAVATPRRCAATDDPADLPRLQAGGFGATVEAYALDGDPGCPGQARLWLVSLLASRQAVEAIWAALVTGKTALLSTRALGPARPCALAPEGPRGWPSPIVKLRESALAHGLIHPRSAHYAHDRADFLLVPRLDPRGAESVDPLVAARAWAALTTQHFRFLNRRVDTPLHPAWATWLWERAVRRGEAAELDSYGLAAYRCAPDVAALTADVQAGIRAGDLPVLSVSEGEVGDVARPARSLRRDAA
jgi:hypothetical protein